MKALIAIVMLTVSSTCLAQGYGEYKSETKGELKEIETSKYTPGELLRKGGNQLIIGQVLTLGSAAMAIIYVNSDQKNATNTSGNTNNYDAMLYASAGVGVLAVILQISGYSNIAKAGRIMDNGKVSASIGATNSGVGLSIRF